MDNIKVYDKTTDKMYSSEEYHISLDLTNKVVRINESPLDYEKGIEAVILPSTGVKDINKKESYLGDIVKLSNSIGVIFFEDGCFEIDWIISKDFYTTRLGLFKEAFEIIGNKFKNVELIKKEV